jgi:hypothetical protein
VWWGLATQPQAGAKRDGVKCHCLGSNAFHARRSHPLDNLVTFPSCRPIAFPGCRCLGPERRKGMPLQEETSDTLQPCSGGPGAVNLASSRSRRGLFGGLGCCLAPPALCASTNLPGPVSDSVNSCTVDSSSWSHNDVAIPVTAMHLCAEECST